MNKRKAWCYWKNPVTKEKLFGMLEVDDFSDIYKSILIDSFWFLVPAYIVAKEIDARVPKI